jgi:N-acetylglutamate synthase-like GNAT family acetyltransferase
MDPNCNKGFTMSTMRVSLEEYSKTDHVFGFDAKLRESPNQLLKPCIVKMHIALASFQELFFDTRRLYLEEIVFFMQPPIDKVLCIPYNHEPITKFTTKEHHYLAMLMDHFKDYFNVPAIKKLSCSYSYGGTMTVSCYDVCLEAGLLGGDVHMSMYDGFLDSQVFKMSNFFNRDDAIIDRKLHLGWLEFYTARKTDWCGLALSGGLPTQWCDSIAEAKLQPPLITCNDLSTSPNHTISDYASNLAQTDYSIKCMSMEHIEKINLDLDKLNEIMTPTSFARSYASNTLTSRKVRLICELVMPRLNDKKTLKIIKNNIAWQGPQSTLSFNPHEMAVLMNIFSNNAQISDYHNDAFIFTCPLSLECNFLALKYRGSVQSTDIVWVEKHTCHSQFCKLDFIVLENDDYLRQNPFDITAFIYRAIGSIVLVFFGWNDLISYTDPIVMDEISMLSQVILALKSGLQIPNYPINPQKALVCQKSKLHKMLITIQSQGNTMAEPIGIVALNVKNENVFKGVKWCELHLIAILEPYQKLGFGAKSIKALIKLNCIQEFDVMLVCAIGMEAHLFLEKMGFKEIKSNTIPLTIKDLKYLKGLGMVKNAIPMYLNLRNTFTK